MPGILLNRLSRPKPGETPAEQLQKGRVLLREEMLPVLCPGGVEGVDYLYLEDIASRLTVHQEGEILARALDLLREGRCDWIAVTEISRLTGDLGVAAEILALCREHQVPLYTRERLRMPYEAWRPESEQEIFIQFFLSGLEVIGYRGRIARAFAAAYPLDAKTGENRMKTFQGLGRYLNGHVSMGYVWNKAEKKVEKDLSIPRPDFIPEGATRPPAYTMFEIVQRVLELGMRSGCMDIQEQMEREAGVNLSLRSISYILRNPFYAGRPTSRLKSKGGKLVPRAPEEYVATEGAYEAMLTWEAFEALQTATDQRGGGSATRKRYYVSGLFRCACGQPYQGHTPGGRPNGATYGYYACRGIKRHKQCRYEQERAERVVYGPTCRHKPLDDWERTPTCGYLPLPQAHQEAERWLRYLLTRPQAAQAITRWEEQSRARTADRSQLRREAESLRRQIGAMERKRENVITLAVDDILTRAEVAARLDALQRERVGLEARLEGVQEALEAPLLSPGRSQALRRFLDHDFDTLWAETEDSEKRALLQAFVQYIPVEGHERYKRFGAPVFTELGALLAGGGTPPDSPNAPISDKVGALGESREGEGR